MAESNKDAQLTYAFIREINGMDIGIPPKNPEASPFARDAGFYFEALTYSYLCQMVGNGSTPEYGTLQQQAVGKFENAYQNNNAQGIKLGSAVNSAAKKAATDIKKMLEETIQGVLDKDYEVKVTNIAVVEGGGKGNPLGDLQIEVNGKKYIFELKWQSAKDYPTRWFSGMSDATLFGGESKVGTFYSFLSEANKGEFWNYKESKSYWSDNVSTKGLRAYLSARFPNNSEAIAFFLRKGNGPNSVQKDDGTIKYVVHAGYIGMEITGFDDLVSNLSGDATKRAGTTQLIRGKNLLLYQNENKENIAGFGVDNYKHTKRSKRDDKAFTFAFYVSQKYLNSKAINQRWQYK